MNSFMGFAAVLLIAFAVREIFHMMLTRRQSPEELLENSKKDLVTVRYPKPFLWMGMLFVVIFVISVIMSVKIVLGLIIILISVGWLLPVGVYQILLVLVWKIDVFRDKDYFIYRTFYSKQFKVSYSDCIGWKYSNRSGMISIITDKRVFEAVVFARNIGFLIDMLENNEVPEINEESV